MIVHIGAAWEPNGCVSVYFFSRATWLLVEFYLETKILKVVFVTVSVPTTWPLPRWWWRTPSRAPWTSISRRSRWVASPLSPHLHAPLSPALAGFADASEATRLSVVSGVLPRCMVTDVCTPGGGIAGPPAAGAWTTLLAPEALSFWDVS